MLDFYRVFGRFRTLAGLTEEESSPYLETVRLAMEQIETKLRPGADAAPQEALLTELAAACACYRYRIMTDAAAGSIRALDLAVTVEPGSGAAAAKKLVEELTVAARDLLRDDVFLFGMM